MSRNQRLSFLGIAAGETVRFRARSENAEEIHVHGYDRYGDLPRPARRYDALRAVTSRTVTSRRARDHQLSS